MAIALDNPRAARDVLRQWLAERLADSDGGQVDDVDVTLLDLPFGGQSNATLPFVASWTDRGDRRTAEFVARLQPAGNQIFQEPDLLREFRVIEGLRGSAVPVPRVFWFEDDPSLLERPFFVMERVAGIAPNDKPSIHVRGWLPTLSIPVRERLWDSALDALVAIHRVDWRGSHAFLADPSGQDLEAHLARTTAWYRWAAAGRELPLTDAALEYLHDRRASVAQSAPALLWGDARLGNMIFADDGAVSAVIDWEFAAIGPPEIDLGWWLMWDEYLTGASGVPRLEGLPDRAATIARYESATGRPLADLDYYELLGALTVATTVLRIADIGIAAGRFPATTRMAHANVPTQMIARLLGLPVPELDPDERRRRKLDEL